MKQISINLKGLLCMLLLLVAVNAWGQVSTATATTGKSYIVAAYSGGKYYALPQITTATTYSGEEVDVNANGKVTYKKGLYLWTLTVDPSNATQFHISYISSSSTYYLYKNGTGNTNYNIKGSTTDSNYWTFTKSSDGKYYNVVAVSRGNVNTYLNFYGSGTNIKWQVRGTSASTSNNNNTSVILLEVEETAAKTLSSIAVSGTPTKTTYEAGEALNPAGLTVTGTYSDNSTATITEGIEWALDPETLTAGATTCDVMASVDKIMSDVYTVTGLTVNAIATKYNVNLIQPAKATIAATPTSAAEGATVTLSYSNLAKHFRFASWYVLDGDANEVNVNEKDGVYAFTMPASAVEVEARFSEDAKHYVYFNVNGKNSNLDEVYEGEAITFPTNIADINGRKFIGWTAEAINGTVNDAPTFVNSATMGTQDITYYAVFANINGGDPQIATMSASGLSTAVYKPETQTDSQGNTWSYYASVNNFSGTLYFGLNSHADNHNIGSPVFGGNVTSIAIKGYNGSSSDNRKLLICSSNSSAQPTSGDIAVITIPKSELFTNTYNADLSSAGKFNQFYIYATAPLGISEITVTYSPLATYSDYCTTVPPAETVSITSACMATYAPQNCVEIPESDDFGVFYVSAWTESTLTFTKLKAGTKVFATEGLLLKSSGGEKDCTFSVVSSDGLSAIEGNKLKGLEKDTYFNDDEALILANGSQGVGFYPIAASTLKAGKAYLDVAKWKEETKGEINIGSSTSAPVIKMIFQDATGIVFETVKVSREEIEKIFNINGVRVSNTNEPGIYIINGKKVVKK